MSSYTISGPYKYDGDLHPCFRVASSTGELVACFYATDGDIDAAGDRAEWYALGQETNNKINRLTSALLAIAHMDCFTRPGEQPAAELMRDLAQQALAHTDGGG